MDALEKLSKSSDDQHINCKVIAIPNMLYSQSFDLNSFKSLQVLILNGNLFNNTKIFNGFCRLKSLIKLDLSFNQITTLFTTPSWAFLPNLKILHLHHNNINSLDEIHKLTPLKSLIFLSLHHNVIETQQIYRYFIVHTLPHLIGVDHFIIVDEERTDYCTSSPKFKAFNPNTAIKDFEFDDKKNEIQIILELKEEIKQIQRSYEKNSFIITLQRHIKGFIIRNKYKKMVNLYERNIVVIQRVIRGWKTRRKHWKQFKKLEKFSKYYDFMYNIQTNEQRKLYKAKKLISLTVKSKMRAYLQKKHRTISAIAIQSYCKMTKVFKTVFSKALRLDEYPHVYFMKEQLPIFKKILANLNDIDHTSLEAEQIVHPCIHISSIRLVDCERASFSDIPIITLLHSQIKAIIRKNKPPLFSAVSKHQHIYSVLSSYNSYYKQLDKFKINNLSVRTKKILTKLNAKPVNDYDDLLVASFNNEQICTLFCNKIIDYNREAHYISKTNCFLPYFEVEVKRIMAATTIKACYKRYKNNRINGNILESIIKNRAVHTLQHHWRHHIFATRLQFLNDFDVYINSINEPTLYLEESMYNNYAHIATKCLLSKHKFEEQYLDFYLICGHLHVSTRKRKIQRFISSVFSQWLKLSIPIIDDSNEDILGKKNDLLSLLHTNSQLPDIVNYKKIANYKIKTTNECDSVNFIKFTYTTIEEAKARASILYLLTYKPFPMKPLTLQMIDSEFIYSYLNTTWNKCHIDAKSIIKEYEHIDIPHLWISENKDVDIPLEYQLNCINFVDQNGRGAFTSAFSAIFKAESSEVTLLDIKEIITKVANSEKINLTLPSKIMLRKKYALELEKEAKKQFKRQLKEEKMQKMRDDIKDISVIREKVASIYKQERQISNSVREQTHYEARKAHMEINTRKQEIKELVAQIQHQKVMKINEIRQKYSKSANRDNFASNFAQKINLIANKIRDSELQKKNYQCWYDNHLKVSKQRVPKHKKILMKFKPSIDAESFDYEPSKLGFIVPETRVKYDLKGKQKLKSLVDNKFRTDYEPSNIKVFTRKIKMREEIYPLTMLSKESYTDNSSIFALPDRKKEGNNSYIL